jgi:gliding motility-associated-like protein
VPSVWYKDNKDVSPRALASDLTDNDYWFREDRLPLPVVMLRQKDNGVTFSVFHKDADGTTFKSEDGLNRVIDGRMKFASVGLHNNKQPLIGMLYPGTEGERTGIFGMANSRRWAYRSHPVQLNYIQNYSAALRLSKENDYISALKNTWNTYYKIQNPDYYNVDLTKVYDQHIAILDKYWRSINNSAGVPFRIKVGGVAVDADYNWDMGFVGQEIPNASLMIREALKSNKADLKSKGEQMVDFWAEKSLPQSGIPRTWYDPYPQTWRQIPTHMRTLGDGMNGMLWAWNFEKKKGVDKKNWLKMAAKVADWLISVQNIDGSFYQQYDFNNSTVTNNTKNNTSNVLPFLVDMYNITGTEKYKQTALKAGDFIYTEIYQNFRYAGGAADNPNVPDKEAVSMALRAFLALYDIDKDSRWLDASKQAAYYYQTWVYAWPVPIPADDEGTIFPKGRQVTGLSAIATANNAADTYAAVDAFNIYRVYLYSGDESLLNFSKLLLQNTKQYVNWDTANPIHGFAPGFLGEAMTIIIPRGHGVDYYLPWQTFNLLEPMVLFEDVFGSYNMASLQNMSMTERKAAQDKYSLNRGFEKGVVGDDLLAQTISFPSFGIKTAGDADFAPGATSTSGLPLTYTSSNTAVATIVNGQIHIVGAGKTTITAQQAGNDKYMAATAISRELGVMNSVSANSEKPVIGQAISPNGDGDNDFLTIEGAANMPGNKLVIFNRQGSKVFEISNYDNQRNVFAGKNSSGSQLPAGTYFYKFSYSLNGKTTALTGYIMLKY